MVSVNPHEYSSVSGNPKAISKIIVVCTDQNWKHKITVNFSLRATVSNFTRELKALSQLALNTLIKCSEYFSKC